MVVSSVRDHAPCLLATPARAVLAGTELTRHCHMHLSEYAPPQVCCERPAAARLCSTAAVTLQEEVPTSTSLPTHAMGIDLHTWRWISGCQPCSLFCGTHTASLPVPTPCTLWAGLTGRVMAPVLSCGTSPFPLWREEVAGLPH